MRQLKIVLLALLTLLLAIVGGGLFYMADPYYLRSPSDSKVVHEFQAHRAVFARLRHMVPEHSHIAWRFTANDLIAVCVGEGG